MLANPIFLSPDNPDRVSCTAAGLVPRQEPAAPISRRRPSAAQFLLLLEFPHFPRRFQAFWRNMAIARPAGSRNIIRVWVSTDARWKTLGRPRPAKRRPDRATDAQILEDAERLIAAWNGRQAKRMPMLFAPTIGAAVAARHWWLWVRCPACRTTNAIDLRTLDRHPDAAITSLIPALSCRSCRPNAPFAELVQLSRLSVIDEWNAERACTIT